MKAKVTFLLIIVLCLSIVANIFFFMSSQNKAVVAGMKADSSAYPLLSKKILDSNYPNDIINNFLPLRQSLHAMTQEYRDNVAFYFEYIPTGTSIGINADSEFTAASLLKVPVVMAYFYKKERLGIKSDPTVTIKANELNDRFGDLYKKGAGTEINLSDAVKLTIQESDNTASLILADQISNEDFAYVYEGLDIEPATEDKNPIITAEQYSSILKALYLSSILTKEDSQYILDLMTKTEFDSMLPSGIPDNITIAHKIGLIDDQIYSDCGIVYVPNRPYLLCMISQSDRKTARARMQEISKTIYDYVAGYKIK